MGGGQSAPSGNIRQSEQSAPSGNIRQSEQSSPPGNIRRSGPSLLSDNISLGEPSPLSDDFLWGLPLSLPDDIMRVRPFVPFGTPPTSTETDVGAQKLRSSLEFLPPEMSELRVVLLGNSWSLRSSVGNVILEKFVFNTEEEPNQCLQISGQVKEKKVVLINTPDLLHPNISPHELTKHVENCFKLSAPGPHVFLLVLQAENFTVEHRLRLQSILTSFSIRSFDHSLVLISTSREESSDFDDHPPLKDLIRQYSNRSLKLKNLERSELLKRLGQTAKENDGDHVSWNEFDLHYLLHHSRFIERIMLHASVPGAIPVPPHYWFYPDIRIRHMLSRMDDTVEKEEINE